jgi:hypothetical protein
MNATHEIVIDNRLLKDIVALAECISISTSEIITSILVDWYARQDSYMRSDGYISRPLVEFLPTDGITEKYQILRSIYDQKYRQEWEVASTVA